MSIIHFVSGFEGYYRTLRLGDEMVVIFHSEGRSVEHSNCRFVKVTRKGFNIIDLNTSRALLKSHLYARGMANKEYPSHGGIRGSFLIPSYISIRIKNRNEEVAS